MKSWKRALLFALCLLPAGLIGGWFAAGMSFSSVDADLLDAAVRQAGSLTALKAAAAASGAVYTVACGFFGYIMAEKIGLKRPFRLESAILRRVLPACALAGGVFSLDAWTFARWIPQLMESYAAAGSFDAAAWIASVLYGGVTEEVMLRLFLMSGLALAGWKLFFRKAAFPPDGVMIAANVVAALAFAAAHIPATAILIGELTPLLLARCFLLNGAFGLLFGRFYRKYGIQYAMLGHMALHIISKTVWLIALP